MCCTEKKGYAEMKELITVGCIVITFDLTLRVLESVIKKCNAKHRRKEDKLIKRKDLLLVKTCGMFPEQYDAYIKETEEMVGYFRLRSGVFTVSYPDCGGEIIFCGHPEGSGAFERHERKGYLNKGLDALLERLNCEKRIYRS